MPELDWWDLYDSTNPFIFPDLYDEMRYDPKTLNEIQRVVVYCCACWKEINRLEAHVLKTLYFGWHMTEECLVNLENWVVDERKRREDKIWNGNK